MSEVTPDLPGAPRGEHPATEVLRAYREGRLGADEQEALQEHLVSCDWCAELLLGLAPRTEEGAAVASHETAADWRKLRQRLAGEGALPAGRRAARLPAWVGWAAAVFFVALLATGWDDASLRRQRDEIEVFHSYGEGVPSGTARSLGSEPITLEVKPQARRALIGLDTSSLDPGPYQMEIVDDRTRVVWRAEWTKADDSILYLAVPLRRLPEGAFKIHLVGSLPDQHAEYFVKVLQP